MKITPFVLKFNGNLETRTGTTAIIVHHAAARVCSVADIHNWHLDRKWKGIGYNFLVRKSGEVCAGRHIWAADSDAFGHNYDSLSICFEGDFEKETMLDAQFYAGVELIKYLKGLYPEVKNVLRHRDVESNTQCPGKNFPNKMLLAGQLKINTLREALNVLVKHGVIKSPEYWGKNVGSVQYLEELLVNMANILESR